MGFSRTLAVFLCVILALLAFLAPDALAARALLQSYGGLYQQHSLILSFWLH
jgi:hypothetical protein